MHCPKCGHQQASEDMRFCSRCGFSLSGVAEILANDGLIPAPRSVLSVRTPRLSRLGAKLVFLSIVLIPVCFALSFAFDSPGPFFISLFFFLAGIAQIAYKRIFSENMLPERGNRAQSTSPRKPEYLAPAHPFEAGSLFGSQTADLAAPPSVTEPTTTLLEKNTKSL
jgi:zinc-ribbon domain